MKNKKIAITLLIILAILFGTITTSLAADSFSASLTPDNPKVGKGEEVKVTFRIKSIAVNGGISGMTATLKYDKDVLTLTKSNIKELNDWSIDFNEDNGNLSFEKAEPVENDEDVATFTFKVSPNTSSSAASIKLVSIKGANSSLNDDVKISDISTTLSISSGGGVVDPSPSQSESPSPSPTTSSPEPTLTNPGSPNPSQTGNTTRTEDPYAHTGSAQSYVLPLIAAIAVLGIVAFINYKKIDQE